jgi:hypothetical protein
VALVFGFLNRGNTVYNILLLHNSTIAKFKHTPTAKPCVHPKIWFKIPIRPLVCSYVGGWLRGFVRNVLFPIALLQTSIVQICRFLPSKTIPRTSSPPLTSRTTAPEHPRRTTPSYLNLPEARLRCGVVGGFCVARTRGTTQRTQRLECRGLKARDLYRYKTRRRKTRDAGEHNA